MKRSILAAAVALVLTPVFAAGESHDHPAPNLPPAFKHLESLVGSWQGVGAGMESTTSSFEVVANGSALVERLSPHEGDVMVNVYHPDGDAVVMTHYCSSGNQPRLRCTKDGSSLAFAMTDITNWKKGEVRMSHLILELVDADHMKQTWTSETAGKSDSFTMEFVRKK